MTQDERIEHLAQMTYRRYLQYYSGLPDDAFHSEYCRGSGSLLGAGGQAVSAADCWVPGGPAPRRRSASADTEDLLPGIGRTPQQDAKSDNGPTAPGPTATSRSSS